MVTVAPAATARSNAASTSGTTRCRVTGEPPSAVGDRSPNSGFSSTSITVCPAIRTQPCISRPSGPASRAISSAPKALA